MAPLRVIIVGGGPNGITAAYALHHAGIDFVVLESRQNVFEDTGASLVLSPHNLRIFHQFGVFENLQEIGVPLRHVSLSFSPESRTFKRTHALGLMESNHGSPVLIFHRAHVLKVIYDGLPNAIKDRYLTNKKLVNIQTTDSGAEVSCEDGSSYRGTFVIGADGAHSKTRSIMRQLALKAEPGLEKKWDPETPYTSSYKCLWAAFPRTTEAGLSYETQSHNRSAMYLSGRDKGWIFLYEKLPHPSTERVTYSKEEVRSFAESFANWQVHETLTIGEIINQDGFTAGMGNLQEGIVSKKSWAGKIVLVGDAAHRFTPNAGLGFNAGIQDVVSLSNRLQSLVETSGPDAPGAEALEEVFQAYQNERRESLAGEYKDASAATRLQAWASWSFYLLARFVFSFGFVRNYWTHSHISPGVRLGLVLKYISAEEPFTGSIPWEHQLKK